MVGSAYKKEEDEEESPGSVSHSAMLTDLSIQSIPDTNPYFVRI